MESAKKTGHAPAGGDGLGAICPLAPLAQLYVPTPLLTLSDDTDDPQAAHASCAALLLSTVSPQPRLAPPPAETGGEGGGGGDGLGATCPLTPFAHPYVPTPLLTSHDVRDDPQAAHASCAALMLSTVSPQLRAGGGDGGGGNEAETGGDGDGGGGEGDGGGGGAVPMQMTPASSL